MNLAIGVEYKDIFPQEKNLIEKIFRGSFLLPTSSYSAIKTGKIKEIELAVPVNFDQVKLNRVKKFLEKQRLTAVSLHQPVLKTSLPYFNIDNLFKAAKELNSRLIVLHSMALRQKIHDNYFIDRLKNLQEQYKIKLAIENNTRNILNLFLPYTYKPDEFAREVIKTGLAITLDTNHLGQSAGNIISFYQKYQKNIMNIHLSDYGGKPTQPHLALGKGNLPIIEFLKLLSVTSYGGQITLEISSSKEEIIRSFELVNKYFS